MAIEVDIFSESFNLTEAIETTRDQGYYFHSTALSNIARLALEYEINLLPLESSPAEEQIREGKTSEVKQRHEKFYAPYGNIRTPAANLVIAALTTLVHDLTEFPELSNWQLSEVGYQRYRGTDHISRHRDRASDNQLSFTFTISGNAEIKIFEPIGDYRDYTNVQQIDEFRTAPGSVMMLRAPGFGSGEQVIHEVSPPENSRSILNLRARSAILD